MSAGPVDYIADWNARLTALVYVQFKDDPNLALLIQNVLAPQAQDLEDSLQTLITLSSIADGVGVQLDNIGRIVGQLRLAFDDEDYRLLLFARVRASQSNGTNPDIYAVFALAAPGAPAALTPSRIASFTFELDTPITDQQVSVYLDLLFAAKLDGVRVIFLYEQYPDSQMFVCAFNGMQLAPTSSGATSINVAGIDNSWPSSGTLLIDKGLSTQETVSFTAITNYQTITLSSALTYAHSTHAEVEVTVPSSPGLGWGDYTDATAGGYMAGAAEAEA